MLTSRPCILGMVCILCAFLLGCSGGMSNPALPENDVGPQIPDRVTDDSRLIFGMWKVRFDETELSLEVEPIRSFAAHFDVTGYILPPECVDCFYANVNSFDPVTRILDVYVTLRNPFGITGHDVRGILFTDQAGHKLLNPDDWTQLHDITGGLEINPFIAFKKSEENRVFAPYSAQTEQYLIYVPIPPDWNGFTFAADASWPGNCKEPYEIYGQAVTGELYNSGTNQVKLTTYVRDWQEDVQGVKVDLTPLGAPEPLAMTFSAPNQWSVNITNDYFANIGSYELWILAKSVGSETVLYDKVSLTVTEPPVTGFARTWGGEDYDHAVDIAVDNNENVYIIGDYNDLCDFDPGEGYAIRDAVEDGDAFLVKFNSLGKFQWIHTWGKNCLPTRLLIKPDGKILIIGVFDSGSDFDPGEGEDLRFTNGYAFGSFLMKFDIEGEYFWTRTWDGDTKTDWEWFLTSDLTVDGNGNIFVTGHFEGNPDFDPGGGEVFIKSNGKHDSYVTKFGPGGTHVWTRTWGSEFGGISADSYFESGYGIAIDLYGDIIISGMFSGIVDFDPGPDPEFVTERAAFLGMYLTKFDQYGVFIEVKTWGNLAPPPELIYCWGMELDSSGNIYLPGAFQGEVDFDPGAGQFILESAGRDACLTKLDPSGNFLWTRAWGGGGNDACFNVEMGYSGEVYASGPFRYSADLDPGPGSDMHTSNGTEDVYLLKLDSDGAFDWARTIGGGWEDFTYGIAPSFDGTVYTCGMYTNNPDFDPGPGIWQPGDVDQFGDGYLLKYLNTGYWE